VWDAARACGAERFLFMSTGDVYAPSASPHVEGDRLRRAFKAARHATRHEHRERARDVHVVRRGDDDHLRSSSAERPPELLHSRACRLRQLKLIGRARLGDREPAMRSDGPEYQTHGRDTKHQWFPHFA